MLEAVEPVLALRASAEGEYYAMLVARELVYRTPLPGWSVWSRLEAPAQGLRPP